MSFGRDVVRVLLLSLFAALPVLCSYSHTLRIFFQLRDAETFPRTYHIHVFIQIRTIVVLDRNGVSYIADRHDNGASYVVNRQKNGAIAMK